MITISTIELLCYEVIAQILDSVSHFMSAATMDSQDACSYIMDSKV